MVVEGRTIVDDAALQAFEAGIRGALIRPEDSTYEEARSVYNAMTTVGPR